MWGLAAGYTRLHFVLGQVHVNPLFSMTCDVIMHSVSFAAQDTLGPTTLLTNLTATEIQWNLFFVYGS
jgi:hypothetical protein